MFKHLKTIVKCSIYLLVIIMLICLYFKTSDNDIGRVGLFVTAFLASVAYLLQAKMKKLDDIRREEEMVTRVYEVKEFLESIIVSINKNQFDKVKIKKDLEFKDDYKRTILLLRKELLTENEYLKLEKVLTNAKKYVSEIDIDIKRALNYIKPLYRELIDLNISPKELEKNNKIFEVVNLSTAIILLKLENYIRKYKNEQVLKFNNTSISVKYNFFGKLKMIKKEYINDCWIELANNKISGNVTIYEPVFNYGQNLIITFEEKYFGEINYYGPSGKGVYYYYSQTAGYNLNSFALCDDGNFDFNAQEIRKKLIANKISENTVSKYEGKFCDGKMSEGKIYYKVNNLWSNDCIDYIVDAQECDINVY